MLRRFEAARVVLLCLGAAVCYGIVQDNFTARICPAYFNVGHPDLGMPGVFHSESPALLAFAWGVVATWWVGLGLGIVLALCVRMGRWPRLGADDLLRPILKLLAVLSVSAVLGGIAGWLLGLGYLAPMAVPADQRVRFGIDFGAHLMAYVVGPIGGLVLCVSSLRRRRRLAKATP